MTPLEQLPIPLLLWFEEHARKLPWRDDPTPYHVWVSEIMLQQTRVAAVLGYYERFMNEVPTVEELAQLPEERLMKLWQGLGYYNRARNLRKAARQIVERFGGVFPNRYEDIRSLAGVGDYTAGAIGSIAFGLPVPAVDGNVLRVVSRINGDDSDITLAATKERVRRELEDIIPVGAASRFNQGMMELGATVCLPNGAPLCEQCPAKEFCRAHLEERTDSLPVKAPKKERRVESRVVFLLFRDRQVALRRRPDKGLLAGMWEFPNELAPGEHWLRDWGIEVLESGPAGAGKHIFSHIEWHMTGTVIQVGSDTLPEGWVWADRQELERRYAVPNAFRAFEPTVKEQLGYF